MGNAEDQVKITHRKQFLLSCGEPFFASVGLALRAVAISAGVVGDGLMTASSALIAMSTQRRCTAAGNRVEHFELRQVKDADKLDESRPCCE